MIAAVALEFQVCDTCAEAQKRWSEINLCPSCIHNRYVIEELWRRLKALEWANVELRGEVDGLRAFKRSVDEALNHGDRSYKP